MPPRAPTAANIEIQPVAASERAAWEPLWKGYLDFYKTTVPKAVYDTTWARLNDPAESMHLLGAYVDGRLLGIVHFLYHRSCWTIGDYCYLQDLFVAEDARKLGLGTAYLAGFAWALQYDFEYIFEMDADFSHDPAHLPRFIDAAADADLVLGSRYRQGKVTVVNWPMTRLMLSYGANLYARWVTGLALDDSTGGFKCFRRRVLTAIDLGAVQSNGYAFQIEMSFRTWKKGFRIVEIPIVFTDRTEGESKMSKGIVREAVFMVWRLRWWALTGKL